MFSLWVEFTACGGYNSALSIFKIISKRTFNTHSFLEFRTSWINNGGYIFDTNSCRIGTVSWIALIANFSINIKAFANRWNHFTNISLIKVISKRAFHTYSIGKQTTPWICNYRYRIYTDIVRVKDITWITGEAFLVFSVEIPT